MKNKLYAFCIVCFFIKNIFADPGDTVKVQTFTFGSVQDAWFNFPSADVDFEKVLMQYTLRCVDGGAGGLSYECGEWDYLTYTYVYEHTGNYDSTLLYHPNYLANGVSPDTFHYSNIPTYSIFPSWNYYILYDDTTSYNEVQIGGETTFYAHPFATENPIAKTQILWKADELIAAGLTAGDITGLQFEIGDIGSSISNLKITLKHTTLTELNTENYETTGFAEVFNSDINFSTGGWFGFDFTTSFNWDGTSNVVMEITFDNETTGINTTTAASVTDFNSVLHTNSNDKYIAFTQPVYATTIENALASLNDVVTISYWAYGNAALQPQNGTCFEAVTESGQRVLNSHTPWSDQNVYWDAGNDGGYDRINKAAVAGDYENTWTHWAFTKNTSTGYMRIYKNGLLWHSGTSKTKLMVGIEKLWLGKGTWGGSESYEGWMDEFAIWNAELDETTIQNYLYKDLDDLHPHADNLLLYYHFNDALGIYETDNSVSDIALAKIGATTHLLNAEDQFRNLQFNNLRPNIKFEQGIFTAHIDSVFAVDSIMNDPITLITFYPDDPTVGIDTILVWDGNYYNYIYDEAGNIVDSTFISATNTINHEEYTYFSAPFEVINRFEIARYITPYGIGLDLGEGFTWTYDVTDYLPLLKDSVHLSAGNWQEDLDLQFIFIEGTPARKPTSVTNLWSGGFSYGLTPSYDDQTPDKTILIPAAAKNTRILSRVTGHGFGGTSNCAEFCKKDHYIFVDGVSQWAKEVWRENCDLNPLYPQGGTWVYDRTNWCPGAEVETYQFELTPFVTPGNTVDLDYDAESYTWNGSGSVPYYQTEVQLITYDEPSFILDAAIEDIIAPSDNDMWSRKNPICNNPIIKIKNNGTTPLTSIQIEFGIKDFEKAFYNWTGILNFLETEEIALPDFPWTLSATEFEITISNPNGSSDEYSYNNYMKSKMELPPVYIPDFVVEMKTNNKPNENDLFIYGANGDTILERTSFEANTTYRDTLHLADGCYEIYLEDDGEDGLSWWANTDGSGYFKLKNIDVPTVIKSFNADFGGLIYQQFIVGNYVDVENEVAGNVTLKIFPNPAKERCYIRYEVADAGETRLNIFDISGKNIFKQHLSETESVFQIDVSNFAAGIYSAVLSNGMESKVEKFVIIE